jgi:hypothetical protein
MSRRARRWWLLAAASGFAALVLAGVVATSTTSNSTQEAFRKIKVGMTRDEVYQLLGDKDFWRAGFSTHIIARTSPLPPVPPPLPLSTSFGPIPRPLPLVERWRGPNECLHVQFGWMDQQLKVEVVCVTDFGPDKRTFWAKIQDEYRYQKSRLGW